MREKIIGDASGKYHADTSTSTTSPPPPSPPPLFVAFSRTKTWQQKWIAKTPLTSIPVTRVREYGRERARWSVGHDSADNGNLSGKLHTILSKLISISLYPAKLSIWRRIIEREFQIFQNLNISREAAAISLPASKLILTCILNRKIEEKNPPKSHSTDKPFCSSKKNIHKYHNLL